MKQTGEKHGESIPSLITTSFLLPYPYQRTWLLNMTLLNKISIWLTPTILYFLLRFENPANPPTIPINHQFVVSTRIRSEPSHLSLFSPAARTPITKRTATHLLSLQTFSSNPTRIYDIKVTHKHLRNWFICTV